MLKQKLTHWTPTTTTKTEEKSPREGTRNRDPIVYTLMNPMCTLNGRPHSVYAQDLVQAGWCRPCACCLSLCEIKRTSIILTRRVLFSWCLPSPLILHSFFSPPLSQGSLSCEGRDLMETSFLGLTILRSLILYIVFGCGSLFLFLVAAEGSFSYDV